MPRPALTHFITLLAGLAFVLIAPLRAASPKLLLLDAALAGPAILAVGEHGVILRSADSGHTWEKIPTPTHATLTAISFANATRGLAVGHEATILCTNDGGLTWSQKKPTEDLGASFLDVLALNDREAIAIGAFGLCVYSQDAGNSWRQLKLLDEDLHLNRIIALPSGQFLVVTEQGQRVVLSKDTLTPNLQPRPYEGSWFGAVSLASGSQLVVGLRSHVLRIHPTQTEPELLSLKPEANLLTAIQLSSGTIVLAGHARTVFSSIDEGQTFQLWEGSGLTTCVAELLEAPDGTLLAFGEAGVTRLPAPPAALTLSPTRDVAASASADSPREPRP